MSDGPWRLVIAGTARRDLDRVPEKYATAVVELLPSIAANPQRLGKPLRFEWAGKWVARRGPYRLIYELDEQARVVTVLAVAHRADIYRQR
ncbi:MAG TPA: type II toxin-antitoxin system RelE/ParE family toxin [Solirubrobacterales bacterium]|nr:type II toxin-antitoxin system RelE/ParE family toxin [Solirubrobacterales bacterium]